MDPLTHSVCLFLHSMEETGTPWWLHLQTRSSAVICAASQIHPKPILYHLFDIMESYIPKKQQHLEYQMKNHDTYSLVQKQPHFPIHFIHVSTNKYHSDQRKGELATCSIGELFKNPLPCIRPSSSQKATDNIKRNKWSIFYLDL